VEPSQGTGAGKLKSRGAGAGKLKSPGAAAGKLKSPGAGAGKIDRFGNAGYFKAIFRKWYLMGWRTYPVLGVQLFDNVCPFCL